MKKLFSLFLILSLICLSGCGSYEDDYTYYSATSTATYTPRPTATPVPIPDILSELYSYYNEHQNSEAYNITKSPAESYLDGEFVMELSYDDVPKSNGYAEIVAKSGSNSFEIVFRYSNYLGYKICAPELIKSVVKSTVLAIAENQSLDTPNTYVENVFACYDKTQYTSVVSVGNYSFAFSPSDIYAGTLTVTDMAEYYNTSVSKYESVSSSQLLMKINEGTLCYFDAVVTDCKSGSYQNNYGTYQCKLIEVTLDNKTSLTVTQFFDRVPVNFEVGKKYTFYGKTMSLRSGEIVFYLEYGK